MLACGESVGGLHGANRLPGNALSEAFVFGSIAGTHAADLVGTENLAKIPRLDIEPFRRGMLSISELKRTLRKSTWKYLSIIRDERSIEQAITTTDEVSSNIEDIRVETVHDLVSLYELLSMITTTRMIATGAVHRQESRGTHFRSDYPEKNDESFKGNFYLENCNNRLTVRYQPVVS